MKDDFLLDFWKVCTCGHRYHLGHLCNNIETFNDEQGRLVRRVCVCRFNRRDYLDGFVSMHALLMAHKEGKLANKISELMELEYEEMKRRSS